VGRTRLRDEQVASSEIECPRPGNITRGPRRRVSREAVVVLKKGRLVLVEGLVVADVGVPLQVWSEILGLRFAADKKGCEDSNFCAGDNNGQVVSVSIPEVA
jgi:hypothetical protein